MVASIVDGQDIESAVKGAVAHFKNFKGNEECVGKLVLALDLAGSDLSDIDAAGRIGKGWTGEEALAISTYCALKHTDDFRRALITAVNHDGDSDSTGAITGNILGAYLGLSRIPQNWVEKVELKDVLVQMADDLLVQYQDTKEWRQRYPGY